MSTMMFQNYPYITLRTGSFLATQVNRKIQRFVLLGFGFCLLQHSRGRAQLKFWPCSHLIRRDIVEQQLKTVWGLSLSQMLKVLRTQQ